MTDKPTTPLPTVHMNGTSHKMLTEGYEDAYFALKTFIKAFGHIEFNGRDYYQQGPDAWMAAVKVRTEINLKLLHISEYIQKHLESLAEQAPKK